VSPGTRVTLFVVSTQLLVPDLVGSPFQAASDRLAAAGFRVARGPEPGTLAGPQVFPTAAVPQRLGARLRPGGSRATRPPGQVGGGHVCRTR
jgi:hypothetical protein